MAEPGESRTLSIPLYSETNKNERCIFNVFRGIPSFTITKDGNMKGGTRKTLSGKTRTKMESIMRTLRQAPVDTSHSLVMSQYDRTTKKFENDYVMTFVKDNEGIYYLDIDLGQNNGGKQRFSFGRYGGVAEDGNTLKPHEQSQVSFDWFFKWFTVYLPHEVVQTNRQPLTKNDSSSNNPNGNNQNRQPTASDGSNKEVPSGYSEDIPF